MTARLATPGDIPAITTLLNAWLHMPNSPCCVARPDWTNKETAANLKSPISINVVSESGGAIVAYVLGVVRGDTVDVPIVGWKPTLKNAALLAALDDVFVGMMIEAQKQGCIFWRSLAITPTSATRQYLVLGGTNGAAITVTDDVLKARLDDSIATIARLRGKGRA